MTEQEMRERFESEAANNRTQIGWVFAPLYDESAAGGFVTQAFIQCCVCRKSLSGTGGPLMGAYCMDCAAAIRSKP